MEDAVRNAGDAAATTPGKHQRLRPAPNATGERPLAITITYCVPCQFTARAAWVAQELLLTYGDYVSGLTLVPGRGGVFEVTVNGETVFSRKDAGRYPELRELKEAINAFLA